MQKNVGVKWVYKTKYNEKGELDKHKARLVAKGYSQQHGINYHEVVAPVARRDTIRVILAVAAQRGWSVYQLDVKSAFLHGELKEDVFVEQPQGFEIKGEEEKVYKLRKALYGLKQALRAWYSRIESYFISEGFEKCYCEHTLLVKTEESFILIVSLYVDDLIFTSNSENMFGKFKSSMMREFSMTDLEKMYYFAGVEVIQNEQCIFINQKRYATEVLERFSMVECNAMISPIVLGFKLSKDAGQAVVDETYFKKIIGSLMYLTATRPELVFSVSLISRYMEKPTELHLQAVKRVMRYLRGTIELGIG